MCLCVGGVLAVGAGAQVGSGASAPPMGWNSWDSYGLTVDEAAFKANAEVMKAKLAAVGYRYAVVDEGWYFENPEDRGKPETLRYAIDAQGRYVPVAGRFPSAAVAGGVATPSVCCGGAVMKLQATVGETSFKPLADWMHAQGLLFGIHIVRGIPRVSVERRLAIADSGFHAEDAADQSDACPWDPTNWGVKDNAAGQAWYDSLLKQYAGWGVDLLKVDCIAAHPYKADEIRMIRRAMDKAGRPMVLSLSPGPAPVEKAAELAENATMWRVSDDVWDVWAKKGTGFPQSLKGQFERAEAWSGDELRTMMTLWAMRQSPLIVGANLTLLDAATLKLLTNREVIRLDQTKGMHGEPMGASAAEGEKDLRVWSASSVGAGADGKDVMFAAMFNVGDAAMTVERSVEELNLGGGDEDGTGVMLWDVWAGKALGKVMRVRYTIPAHGVVLLERR